MWAVDYSTNTVTLTNLSFLDHSFQFAIVKQRNACDHCPMYSSRVSGVAALKTQVGRGLKPRNRDPIPKMGGVNLLFWPIFPKNCVQMTKKVDRRVNGFSSSHKQLQLTSFPQSMVTWSQPLENNLFHQERIIVMTL